MIKGLLNLLVNTLLRWSLLLGNLQLAEALASPLFSALMPSETIDSLLPVDVSRPRINVLFALSEMHRLSLYSFCSDSPNV